MTGPPRPLRSAGPPRPSRPSGSSKTADIGGIARDPAALEAFYLEHFDAVLRFVVRRVDDAQSAADLTADVFMAAVKSAHTYRGGPGGARAWLYGVARNVIAGDRHRAIREGEASRRAGARRLTDPDDIARVEEQLDAEHQVRELYRAVRELPEADRAVLELVSVDGLGVTEAARALGIGAVAARTRLHRARRRLARLMESRAQDPAPPAAPRPAAAPALASASVPLRAPVGAPPPGASALASFDPSRSMEVRP
ncbi:RNA polymerase sigma factor [Yinghuangia soli]|uniref:Sigma-70 family RNA polymerase sigma factor n=1 Tax=Yinghuangia soli TaxID=2908204 RepID=A0AA41U5U8_9ACTN|nr:sigma-70 family RNA polymerase sigma factor [Yinghuangia soli]MCF2530339.1 sigma-70 family RNA polymerase sigma factor [Yinghuangia soli]